LVINLVGIKLKNSELTYGGFMVSNCIWCEMTTKMYYRRCTMLPTGGFTIVYKYRVLHANAARKNASQMTVHQINHVDVEREIPF
jgi:hypothetical protein